VTAPFDEIEIVLVSCDPGGTAHTLSFPYPIEAVRSYRMPQAATTRRVFTSGHNSVWARKGHWGVLRGEVRWIPSVSALTLPDNDGWEDRDDGGTTREGWNSFLRHARRGGAFTFYPDAADNGVSYDCRWLDASIGKPELETDMTRMVLFAIRTVTDDLIEGYSQ